jgi:hypothetical protein
MDQSGTGPAFIDLTEAYARVNESIASLWDVLIAAKADEQLAVREEFSAAGPSVDLSASALGLTYEVLDVLALDVRWSGRWCELTRFGRDQRNDWQLVGVPRPHHFRLTGGTYDDGPTLRLLPEVTGTYDFRLEYIPEPPTLDDDADVISFQNRWWQWVQLDLAISYLVKQESDPSALMARRDRVEARITSNAAVSMGEPRRVKDVRARRAGDRYQLRDWLTSRGRL